MDIFALLFPREKKFYKMIEEQVVVVCEAVGRFENYILNYHKLSDAQRNKFLLFIRKKEQEDDVLYTRMVGALKSTFITPMDREDLHHIVAVFDNVIDTLELITLKLNAYNIKRVDKYIREQTVILAQSFSLIEKIILSIRKESVVEKYCLEIRSLEQKGDIVYVDALKNLFSDSLKPTQIIKFQDIYNSIEEMTDRINEVSVIIENIVVKYS